MEITVSRCTSLNYYTTAVKQIVLRVRLFGFKWSVVSKYLRFYEPDIDSEWMNRRSYPCFMSNQVQTINYCTNNTISDMIMPSMDFLCDVLYHTKLFIYSSTAILTTLDTKPQCRLYPRLLVRGAGVFAVGLEERKCSVRISGSGRTQKFSHVFSLTFETLTVWYTSHPLGRLSVRLLTNKLNRFCEIWKLRWWNIEPKVTMIFT